MRNRATLALIELCVMLLVLALAAALCLRSFVWADTRSRENAIWDAALADMQSAAEVLKSCGSYEQAAATLGGSFDGGVWQIPGETYTVRVTAQETKYPGLAQARVEAVYDRQVIISFTVSWQEVP